MLNRDFTKSNKEYISKNKLPLIIVASILLIGIIIMAIFGLRGNFEITGYNEFSVTVGGETDKYDEYIAKIEHSVDKFGGEYDSYSIFGEGNDTKIVVRYMSNLSNENKLELNLNISSSLGINVDMISEHKTVSPVVNNIDYIYTAVTILFLFVVVSIFAYVRYNGASAVTLLFTCTLATLGFLSLTAILRLSIGISYLAMLVILNLLVMYLCIQVFENIREESYLNANDYGNAIKSGMRRVRFQSCVISCAVLAMGILFVIFAPNALKYVSLNILFMSVVLLASVTYVLPFAWSIFITMAKHRKPKTNKKDEEVIGETQLEE